MALKTPSATLPRAYVEELHRVIDKAISDLEGVCNVEVEYGTRMGPHRHGYLERRHNGVVSITISPSTRAELCAHRWINMREISGPPLWRCPSCGSQTSEEPADRKVV